MNFDFVFDNEPDVMDAGSKIRVVYCEPGCMARIIELGTGLNELQKAVGGSIEPYYGLDDPGCCLVCDEEGKYDGALPNRAVKDKAGKIVDVIFGPFFICDCRGEEFASLSDEQIDRYLDQFRYPEIFYMEGKTVAAVPYDPVKDEVITR